MMHRCIDQLREKAKVVSVCRVLGVSRSGYYAARARAQQRPRPCPAAARLQAAFTASGRSYGSRRLQVALRTQGVTVGRHRVRTLMRQQGLRPVWKRAFVVTTDSAHTLPVAPNILDRQFQPAACNRAWAGDITYIPTRSGWLYLAVVLDLFSRKVVGWAMASRMQSDLVCSALRMAIGQRQPPAGLIVHTDQGSQYASAAHRSLLERHRLQASMSRRGNCWDNAVAERFFLNLKTERVWQRDYANHGEATRDIADYIVGFYNTVRIHSTLGYLPPTAYERTMAAKQPIDVSEKT
jgi:putative transposase